MNLLDPRSLCYKMDEFVVVVDVDVDDVVAVDGTSLMQL